MNERKLSVFEVRKHSLHNSKNMIKTLKNQIQKTDRAFINMKCHGTVIYSLANRWGIRYMGFFLFPKILKDVTFVFLIHLEGQKLIFSYFS